MSRLDKIIDHITQEAREEADKILSSARNEAAKLISTGKRDADEKVKTIAKQSGLDVAAAVKRIQSASELQEKRIILQAKQEEIEKVFSKAVEELESLDDEKYFKVLEGMISRYSSGEAGRICMSAKDIARMPDSFKKAAEKAHLSIDDTPANISGGFILSYGDIEENCSFDVLINTSKEELQDKIGQLLFK